MMGVYNQLLDLNQGNYNNILSGYQQGQQLLGQSLGQAYAGYGNIQDDVMRMLGVDGGGWGVATPGANQIRQDSTRTAGDIQQRMINAGLGNSTVMASMANQNRLQTNQAYGELSANLADKAAGYRSQIGLARQQAMMQGAGLQAQMSNNYLNTLGGYRFQNTAGDLTGQFSNSVGNSVSQSQAQSLEAPNYGGGGGYMGSRGTGITGRGADPNFGGGRQEPYDPFAHDLTAINYAAGRPQTMGYSGGSNVLNFAGDPRLWAGGNQSGRTGGGALGYDVSRLA
jgi:hypothetical protein